MRRFLFTLCCVAAFAAVCVLTSGEEARPAASASPAALSPSPVPAGEVALPDVTDVVVLKDGKRIKGKLIAAGAKSVVILVEEKGKPRQLTIPRKQVKEIIRGKAKPKSDYYETGIVDGAERITRRKSASATPAGTAPPGSPGSSTARSARPAASPRPAPGKLTPASPTATILAEFVKDRNFAGLIKIIGYAKAKEIIDRSKGKPYFAKMLEGFNKNGRLAARDVNDLVKKSGVKFDKNTEKRIQRFLSDIAWRR